MEPAKRKISSKIKQHLLVIILLYASLLILGGIFGHTSQSIWAIISSVASGLILVIGWWLVLHEKKHALLFNLACVSALTLFFTYRWFLTGKFYPPGFLALVSFLLVFKIWPSLKEVTGP